jgi:hypothetical protein
MATASFENLGIRRKAIPAISNRCDDLWAEHIRFDLSAQPTDLIVDRSIKRPGHSTRSQVQQLFAAEHHARPFEKNRQQFEVRSGQRCF